MTEQFGFTVRHASVVLVSAAPIDPQSIRPEILNTAGIVPGGWASKSNINTPVLSHTEYPNGFIIQIDGNRCVFQESIGGDLRDTYEVHPLAGRYVDATKLVSYVALGINWLLDLDTGGENPDRRIREKAMGCSDNFPGFSPRSLQMVKRFRLADCNLTFRVNDKSIEVDCNYHFQTEGRSVDVVASTLDSWQDYQMHLTQEIVPKL